jgi:hypothetical protein
MKKNKNKKVKSIDYFYDDLCDLIQQYFPKGWTSENDQLFFDDYEIMEDFNEANKLLTNLIRQTKGKK